jgi:hypothetical protein
MAVGDYALTSWVNAKAMFGYLDDESAKVEKLIDIATARMEQYSRLKIKARDYVGIMVDGSDCADLLLPYYPINSIASIIPDSARGFDVALALATDEYVHYPDLGIVTLYSGSFPSGAATVKVTYNGGYDEDHYLSPLIEGACLEFVHWLKTRFAGGIGKRTETNADGMSVGYEIDMPLNVRQVLDEIKRRDR